MGEARSALLIGIGRYDNSADLKSLDGPRVDVQSMRAVLEDPAVGGYRVEALEDVDSATACGHLEDFLRDRSENETCLLYFSGHGFIDANGALYLCTTNASFKRPKTSTIPANFVSGLIDECQSKRVVLLLDCCYSGNYDGSAKAADVVQPQFGGTGYGRVVLTAGAENQLAWDNGNTGSLFSRHIAEGIRSGAADVDGDGRITVHELYDYVYRKVVTERPAQRPGKTTYRESGPSFLIAESPKKPRSELPSWVKQELGSPFVETRLNALNRLEDYVRENAPSRDLALQLVRPLLEDDSQRVQRAAHGLLGRLGSGGSLPWRAEAAAAPARAAASSEAPPEAPPDERKEFKLKVELMLWGAWAILGTTFLIALPAANGLFAVEDMGAAGGNVFLCASLLFVGYTTFIAVRYRAVPGIVAAFRSWWWWLGAVALVVAYVLIDNRLKGGIDTISFFACSYLGVAGFVMLVMRFRILAAIGVAVPVWLAWLFGLVAWPMDLRHGDELYFAVYFVATALMLGLGALARFRYLKTHGR
jgi:hypothetical protein